MRRYVKSRSGGLPARWLLLCVMILALSIYPGTALALTGTGTSEDPYLISTADDLDEFKDKVNEGDNNAWGKLTQNIDLIQLNDSEVKGNWTPIGLDANGSYTGTFDGCGYEISHLTITDATAQYAGLFGYIGDGCTIKNLTVQGEVTAENGYIGLIAGFNSGGTINGCHAQGNVTGETVEEYWLRSVVYTGGVVGSNGRGTVVNCTYSGTVTGESNT